MFIEKVLATKNETGLSLCTDHVVFGWNLITIIPFKTRENEPSNLATTLPSIG
jgi:hypothetical protein